MYYTLVKNNLINKTSECIEVATGYSLMSVFIVFYQKYCSNRQFQGWFLVANFLWDFRVILV